MDQKGSPSGPLSNGGSPRDAGESQPARTPIESLEGLKRLVDGIPEVRRERIRALKKAILEKTYIINSDAIARRLVNEAAGDALHRGRRGLGRWPSGG